MDTGVLIAVQIIGLYVCLGPVVCLGLYVLFDRLAERDPGQKRPNALRETDPALWTPAQVDEFFARKKMFDSLTAPKQGNHIRRG